MDEKEKWADEVLNSLQGIERATPENKLFEKIRTEILAEKYTKTVSLRHLAWTAIAASVIIAINVYAVKLHADSRAVDRSVIQNDISLLNEYFF